MENSSDGSLQIAEPARRVGLSRRQLERLFVAQLHDTPAAIHKRLRLDRARQLLALSRSPLTEIAFDLGFDNVSHLPVCSKGSTAYRPASSGPRRKARVPIRGCRPEGSA